MSRHTGFLLAIILALGLAACGKDDDTNPPATGAADSDRITVVATTVQIGALAREVAADDADVQVIIGPGADPHSYDPTPDDLRRIAGADLILRNGLGLDDFLDDIIQSAGGSAGVATVTDGAALRQGGNDHDHGEYDPHVWHDPANAKTMVDNIAKAMSDVDPDRASLYTERAAAYRRILDETDAEIRSLLAEIPSQERKVVTVHDSLGYFLAAYDLELAATIIPGISTDAEPSARHLADLIDLIEREDIRAVLAESTIDPRIAEQIANDTGIKIVYGIYADSLGEPGSGADTVHGMLLANARKISEALQ